MSDDHVKITMRHIRQAKMCSKGTRAFFLKHGIDWQKFLADGVDAGVLEATGDEMALHVVRVAKNGR